jgi:hypothetical protein
MKSLTTPLLNHINSDQTQFAVIFDFYLKSAIVTPWGTTDRLRLTKYPGGLQFFNPQFAPEPVATRGTAASYTEWPVDRGRANVSLKNSDDAMVIRASNVTAEFAGMLNHEEWRDVPVIIRLTSPLTVQEIAGGALPLTADDCSVIFSGQIDEATITRSVLEFSCSNDLGGFDLRLPRENMHRSCRFRYADDMCGAIKFAAANFRTGVVADVGSTTTRILCSTLTDDSWAVGVTPVDRVNVSATMSASHDNANAVKVKSTAAGEWNPTFDVNWADTLEGYWAIKVAQAGTRSELLQPYLQFDFGAAFTMGWWSFESSSNTDREEFPRLVALFSSSNAATWVFERYFEYPANGGVFEFPVHGSPSHRYRRMCFRTRWSDSSLWGIRVANIKGYAVNKNYWAHAMVEFSSSTSTVALRGRRTAVMGSWQGALDVAKLPVAPAAGDTFKILRGCSRTLNACSEREHSANVGFTAINFGGFDSLPYETIVK